MQTEVKILSLGLGVQSTAIYYMCTMGIIPRIDFAIFADTGREKQKTYDYLDYLKRWAAKNDGPEIIVKTDKNLYADLLNKTNSTAQRFAPIPAYTKNTDGTTGMLRRQCTGEYKIAVVDNCIRDEIYNLASGSRRPATEVYKGITTDEIERMSIPMEAWKVLVYPFCGYRISKYDTERIKDYNAPVMNRTDLIVWYMQNSLPIPPKSSCVFCPYTSEATWHDMKQNEPEDFEAACKVDDAIRDSSKQGVSSPIYLHESCQPLRSINFNSNATDLFKGECTGEECMTGPYKVID